VEAEFATAAAPPVHPTKPGLQPVRVLPILPDLDGWAGPGSVLVAAGADPLAGVSRGSALSSAAAAGTQDAASTARLHAWLAGRAVMKSYSVPAPALPGGVDRFVAFMVPAAVPSPGDLEESAGVNAAAPPPLAEGGAPGPDTTPYDWVREFGYKIHAEPAGAAKRTFLFDVREGAVVFSDLSTRVVLHPRPPPPPGGEDEEGFARPSKVFLQQVEPGEADAAAAAKRLAALTGEEG
jgi:hypothetical protein